MSGLLASVCSVAEADIALQSGADIIDCKDPRQGALGPLPPELITRIVQRVGGARPVSATTGDLDDRPRRLRRAVQATADCGVDYVKFGLFQAEQTPACLQAIRDLSAEQGLIAVCFADRFDPTPILATLAEGGCRGVMVDTADKHSGCLTELWTSPRIARFVALAREHGLLCGLAGKLGLQDIPSLIGYQADYLGFRSALCGGGDRRGGLDRQAFMRIRGALPLGQVTAPVGAAAGVLH